VHSVLSGQNGLSPTGLVRRFTIRRTLMVSDVRQARLHAPDVTPHPTGKGPNVSLEAATPPNPEAPPLNPANTARRNENVFAGQLRTAPRCR
jgi:hypothetical protein